jgi:C4-type Zn-finger protein
MTDYHLTNIECPRCQATMEWAGVNEKTPHLVDYHCDNCAWRGDYNHLTADYDEYSSEDYVFSENWSQDEILRMLADLGCKVERSG